MSVRSSIAFTMHKDAVQEFVEFVESLLIELQKIRNTSFRKVLYLVMLDGLSTYRFPEGTMSSGKRFVEFIDELGDWADSKRVSVPQLDLLSHEEGKEQDENLRQAVTARLRKWEDGFIYQINEVDPFPEELPASSLVGTCQHSNLLWAYRNVLIHEFREPGFEFPMDALATTPYYHQMDHLKGPLAGKTGWELVIPPLFLENLVKSCLSNLGNYLTTEGIDPERHSDIVGVRGLLD